MKISYTLILAINLALFTASSVATPIGNIGNGVIISPPPPPDGPKIGPKGLKVRDFDGPKVPKGKDFDGPKGPGPKDDGISCTSKNPLITESALKENSEEERELRKNVKQVMESLMPSSKNIELHWKCKELSRAGIKTSKNSDIVNRDRCLDNGIFLLEASVNWTEYNKWVEAGRPYEEHDEILMNLEVEMDLLKQDQLVRTKRHVKGRREYGNGNSNHRNSETQIEKPGRQALILLSQQEPKPSHKKGEYRNQAYGSNNVPAEINRKHESYDPRSTESQDS
uniref:Uncharacterized protein n=2 Tax=Rhizophagus irregularis TaxID=588596 RepID=U9ST45_RHIID